MTNNNTFVPAGNRVISATGSYRLPRNFGQRSITLTLDWDGQEAVMRGGKEGDYRITTTDIKRVQAHWTGYCSNNRGLPVKPMIKTFYAR